MNMESFCANAKVTLEQNSLRAHFRAQDANFRPYPKNMKMVLLNLKRTNGRRFCLSDQGAIEKASHLSCRGSQNF